MLQTTYTPSAKASITVNQLAGYTPYGEFEAFYDTYAGAFYGEILRRLYSQDIAQRTLELACANLFKSYHLFDPAKETRFIWAFKMVQKEISRQKVEITLNSILFSFSTVRDV